MGRHAIDMTGQRFGNLVVLRRAGTASDTGRQALWKCQCDCGGVHTVLGQTLRSGNAQRCPACVKAGRMPVPTDGGITVVRLWFYQAGATGGFATARDLETGELLAHSNWSRRPLGAAPWQGYGPLRYVLKRLVHIGRAKPKAATRSYEQWAKANAIQLQEPSWFTSRTNIDALWQECIASGRGPKIIELDRGPNERRVASTATLIEDPA